MDEPRVIKKYPNRRLYDTALSRYITLEDVRRLVLDRVEFRVLDAKSGTDLTRSVLLQIILEQEADGEPIFSTQMLEQIIRFYGQPLQAMIAEYLESGVKLFVEQQERVRRRVEETVGRSPLDFMREVADQNLDLWRRMQEGFIRAAREFTTPTEQHASGEHKKDRSD